MNDIPNDPFVPEDAQDLMTGLNTLYVAALRAGFPEQRAFELVNNLFINQMAVLQAFRIGKEEQEG